MHVEHNHFHLITVVINFIVKHLGNFYCYVANSLKSINQKNNVWKGY